MKALSHVSCKFLAIALIVAMPLPADELIWTGGGGIFFNDAGNWSPGQIPNSDDNLTFGAAASKFDLIIAGPQSANEMRFLGGDYRIEGGLSSLLTSGNAWIDGATVTADGANTAWNSANDVTVGDTTAGTLNLLDGASLGHFGLFLGQTATGHGVVNLDGSTMGSSNAASTGRIGVNGTGELHITNGGRSDMSDAVLGQAVGATGMVTVDGTGSDFVTNGFDMRAGNEGTGTIQVTNGGRILATGNGNLTAGHLAGSSGTITVDNGIADVGNRILIGRGGTGTFMVTNGSTVNTNNTFVLGELLGSQGTATIDNSTLSVDNSAQDLEIGRAGRGQMTLQNGAAATVRNDVIVGYDAGNMLDNRLEITGGSSLSWGDGGTDDEMFVGLAGKGTLTVNGGSTVSGRNLLIGNNAGSEGVAVFDGTNTAANLGFLFVGNSGTGTATVSGGAQINLNTNETTNGNLFVGDSDVGDGTLTITGAGSAVTANKRPEIGGSVNETGGTGVVHIENGGSLTAPGAVLGYSNGGIGGDGTVNVDGSGSTWDSRGSSLFVGFQGPGRVEVTNGGLVQANAFYLGRPVNNMEASVTIDGAGSQLDIDGASFLGDGRAATVDVMNGGNLTTRDTVDIGSQATADGAVVTVDSATWNHIGESRIKVGGDGGSAAAPSRLIVRNGGVVTADQLIMVSDDVSGSHGRIEVDGAGSSISFDGGVIGDVGPGTVQIANGGGYHSSGWLDISGSGIGVVTVDGTGSTLSVADELAVGRSNTSNGTLVIGNGGTVTSGQVRIAELGGSTGLIEVNTGGSLIVNSDDNLTVGGINGAIGGNGTLNVQGGLVDVANNTVSVTGNGTVNLSGGTLRLAQLGRQNNSDFNFTGGRLSLTGGQSLDASTLADIFNDNPELHAGMTLEVTGAASLDAPLRLNGGRLTTHTIGDVANLDWDAGTFELTGSDLTVAPGGLFGDQLFLNPGQNLEVAQQIVNDGLISAAGNISAGSLVNNGDLVLLNADVNGNLNTPGGSTVTVVGSVDFNGSVAGAGGFFGPGTSNFNAIYDPGDSPAVVPFEGSVQFGSQNALAIELGGSSIAQFDQLAIEGSAMLDGALNVTLTDLGLGLFEPQMGDSFPILTAAGGLSGAFASFDFPTLAGGRSWELNSIGNTLFLDVVGGILSGDFDNDGDLDGADIDSLVSNLAAMTGDLAFDLTGDGALNEDDLAEWLVLGGAE
ncbi:MAG: hypothetical protein AAGF97_12045, partial [Planctomycetota bacterium]